MAYAKEIIEKVTKTIEVDERTGVVLTLTKDEADFLCSVLARLPGKYSYQEAGYMYINEGIYAALSEFARSDKFVLNVKDGSVNVEKV